MMPLSWHGCVMTHEMNALTACVIRNARTERGKQKRSVDAANIYVRTNAKKVQILNNVGPPPQCNECNNTLTVVEGLWISSTRGICRFLHLCFSWRISALVNKRGALSRRPSDARGCTPSPTTGEAGHIPTENGRGLKCIPSVMQCNDGTTKADSSIDTLKMG